MIFIYVMKHRHSMSQIDNFSFTKRQEFQVNNAKQAQKNHRAHPTWDGSAASSPE